MDREKSELIQDEDVPERVEQITKLVLKSNCIGNRKIFRISENPIDIYITDELEITFSKNNISGYKAISV